MSRFYASIQGNRGKATRQGHASSGITGHVRGWDIGGRVTMEVDEQGRDVVIFEVTHGSNGHGGRDEEIGRFHIEEGRELIMTLQPARRDLDK